MFASCDDEPDPAEREHDSNLIGEWILSSEDKNDKATEFTRME